MEITSRLSGAKAIVFGGVLHDLYQVYHLCFGRVDAGYIVK
jgi:hypothetical protein